MSKKKRSIPPKPPEQVALTVELSVLELSALSFVVMTCTSAVEQVVANAAERGYQKIREAAKKHPRLPSVVR
ncbi:hypothetical protein ACTG9Q_28805 [Actinokineospora sp. 24-640]